MQLIKQNTYEKKNKNTQYRKFDMNKIKTHNKGRVDTKNGKLRNKTEI